MDAVLVMIKADGSRRSFPLPEGSTTVGRKNSCGLRIPLTSVSRLHCEFRVDGDRVSLRDLGSSNGTLKNGERVQDTDLHAGDEVEVGPVRFKVIIDGEPAESDPGDPAAPSLEGSGDASVEASEAKDDPSGHSGLPTTGLVSGGASVDLTADEATEASDELDDDDELAAAMSSLDGDDEEDGDGDGDISLDGDPDDSSEFDFTLDDDEDESQDEPTIELLGDDDKP